MIQFISLIFVLDIERQEIAFVCKSIEEFSDLSNDDTEEIDPLMVDQNRSNSSASEEIRMLSKAEEEEENMNILLINNVIKPKKRCVTPHPPAKLRKKACLHMPLVNSKHNRCRMPGCSKKARIACSICKVTLCLVSTRNCFTLYHEMG